MKNNNNIIFDYLFRGSLVEPQVSQTITKDEFENKFKFPVRVVNERKDQGNIIFKSNKMKRDIYSECSREDAVYRCLENSDQVMSFIGQPVKIDMGYHKTYIPDIALLTDEGKVIIVEVKRYEDFFNNGSIDILKKALAALKYCNENGYSFTFNGSFDTDKENIKPLKEISAITYNTNMRQKVLERLSDEEPVYKGCTKKCFGIKDDAEMLSFLINNDLFCGFQSNDQKVEVCRLPNTLSFKPLIGKTVIYNSPQQD